MNPGEKTVLYHREKHENVTQEIAHHFGLTSAVIVTPGRGPTVWAMHKNDVKMLIFYTNKAHFDLLTEFILERMCNESEKESCPYYFPRSKAIEDHGLPGDELQGEEPTNNGPDHEGEDGECEGECEGEGEEEEEEEDDEEEEEDDAGDAVVEPDVDTSSQPTPSMKRPAAAGNKPTKKAKAA